eukprot:gene13912-biopygen2036
MIPLPPPRLPRGQGNFAAAATVRGAQSSERGAQPVVYTHGAATRPGWRQAPPAGWIAPPFVVPSARPALLVTERASAAERVHTDRLGSLQGLPPLLSPLRGFSAPGGPQGVLRTRPRHAWDAHGTRPFFIYRVRWNTPGTPCPPLSPWPPPPPQGLRGASGRGEEGRFPASRMAQLRLPMPQHPHSGIQQDEKNRANAAPQAPPERRM